ncbi:MAG: hypothetical protein J6V23_07090 [Bacteroidaceae bacterium]|nr:hypothetical protein [Bacteroidaceae bacterium]
MSRFSEIKKNRRKNENEEDNKKSSSATSNSGKADNNKSVSRFSQIKANKAKNAIGLDTFQSDLSAMGKTISNIYNGWQNEETMKNTRSSIESMQRRINAYQEYQKIYGGADLSEIASGYKSLLEDWDERTKIYGDYKNAEEYSKAMKLAKEEADRRASMPKADLNAVQSEIDRLEGLKNSEYFSEAEKYRKQRNAAKSASGRNGFVYDPKTSQIEANYNTATENLNKFLADEGFENAEALQKTIVEKTQYKNQAKVVQDRISLEKEIREDADFDKYVSLGEALGDEKEDGWLVPDNKRKNAVAYLRNNPEAMEMFEESAKSANGASFGTAERLITQGSLEYKAAKYGTDEQLKNYYAYLGKGDAENARRYLESIEEDLNYAMGEAKASEQDNTAKRLLYSITAGLDQFEQNTKNAFNTSDNYIPSSPTQVASGMVRDELDDVGFDILGKSLGQIGYDLGTTTANMAPSILASSVVGMLNPAVGAVVGAGTMGVSASGGAYQEKLNQGWDKGQARVYSTAIGISEGALQYALGGIGKLGGKLSGKSIQAMATGIDNGLARFFATMPIKMASEFTEESLQEVISPFIENLALGYAKNNWSDVDLEEVAYSGILGALSAGFLESGGTAVGIYKENSSAKGIGEAVRANEKTADVFNIASLTPQESDAYNLYTQYAKKGVNAESASDLQLGRLVYNSEIASRDVLSSRKSSPLERVNAGVALGQIETIKNDEKLKNRAKELSAETKNKKPLEEGINIQGIKLGKDTKIVTDNGEVSVDEVVLPERQAEAIARAEQMPEDVANLFIAQYDGETDINRYTESFNLAVAYSVNAFPQETILKNKGVLSEKQVAEIYKATRTAVVEANQKAIDDITQKHSKGTFLKGTFDDAVVDYTNSTTDGSKVNWKDLTSRQRSAIKFAKMFSKATGVNIRFIQSAVEDGKRVGKNGSYDPNSNTIEIDVYAGIDGQYVTDAIIPTLSHELTHWMKAKSPAIYERIKNDLVPFLAEKKGLSVNDLVANEMTRIKATHPELDVTAESAMDELVARACEDMLSNSNQVRKLLAKMSLKEQQNFVEKVKETLNNLMEWANELLAHYKSESEEAKLLREYRAKLKKVSKMWDDMLVSSIEANQALQKEGITGEALANVGLQFDAESQSVAPVQLSERTWTNSEYVQNREVAISAIMKALDISNDEATRYVDNINSIARAIADDRVRLDYAPNADDNASVLKSNKEYKWTVDMSTLCAKRLLFTGTFDAIQKRLPNTAFNSEDIVALRSMMQERGYEVACGICYVESTRRELGTITADFIERYKLAQKTGKPITRVNSEGKVVELKKTKEQMETTMDKSTDRFYADKNYTPTLAELNTTDIDRVKVEHPLVYEAYLQYMNARGQAKPKLLETRAEYKGEILKHFNKSAVNARNKAGGLRVQSFSDFEVAHLIDMMQIVLDMSRVGLMSQAYTKVPAFADVFGGTGMKINLSLIAKGTGLGADGNLIFDDIEGIDHKEAFRLRDKYSKNVGTILVGKNDAHIIKALADPRIDYIIPYHKSFWKESLYEALGLEGYMDYTETQNEKPIDKDRKINNFQPSEYWDYSKSGDENAQTYLAMCKEDGRIPKFPQFQGYPGYWKLLIDFKMYDNDGVGSPQTVVRPNFSMDEAMGILNSYEGGHRTYPVAQDVVDDFVKKYNDGVKYSDRYEVMDISNEMYNTMENHFGTTNKYDVAGYLLLDGKMLDFSGKHWGDDFSTSRQVDHRDIQEVLEDSHNGVQSMVSMISNGNIRLMPETGGINLAKMPNGEQLSALQGYINHFKGEVVIDIDEIGGDTVHSFNYSRGTSASKILHDISGYFQLGEIPTNTKSSLADFHMQYSDRNSPESKSIKEQLEQNQGKLAKMDVVASIETSQQFKSKQDAYEWAVQTLKQSGYKVERFGFGTVIIDEKRINNGLRYLKTDTDRIAFALIPKVIKRGIAIEEHPNHKDRGYKTITFAAPVEIDGERKNMAVVVRIEGKNYYKLHRVLSPDGGLFEYKKESDTERMAATTSVVDTSTDIAFDNSIPHIGTKSQEQFSDRISESVYDKMGETERLLKDNERLKKDLGRLKERLSIEGQVKGGTAVLSKDTDLVAGHIRKIADSTFDKDNLSAELKELYTYMRESSLNGTWNEDAVFAKAYELAEGVLADAKPKTVPNDYAKYILREIRSKRISLSETQMQEAQSAFGKNWRNSFWGKVVIANDGISLDSQWQEWASTYPDFFKADVTEGDQITALYDIYDALKEVSEIVQEYDAEERTRWLAEEILNKCWTLPVRFTIADKYDARIKQLNFEHRQTMKEMRDDYEKRVKEQHQTDKLKYKDLVKKVRDRKDTEIAEAKKLGKERLDKYKENAERKAKIQSITANALTLNKWLTKNSKDYHIHEAMKGPVTKLLQSLDFSSKRMIEKGIPTQNDVSFGEAFADVKAMLVEADNMVAGLEPLYGHGLAEDVNRLVKASYQLVGDNNYVINAMSLEELNSLDHLVKHIKKVVTELNNFHTVHHNQGAVNLASEFVEYGDRLGKLKKQDGKIGKFLKFRNRTPYYFFKTLGNAGRKIFEAFQDGWDRLAFNAKKIIDFTEQTYTDKEVKAWGKETKEFTLSQPDGSNRTFTMSIAQIMSLYCVYKQEDAQRHLLSSGMTLSRLDKKGNVVADYENISVTKNDIDSIIGTLNNRQIEVADKLQEFMNTVCADWGNEISMARFAVKMFTNPDYFPIKVSASTIPTDNTKELDNASLFRLLNMSFTHSRNKYADQSIEVGDIFDIFAQHSTDMAKYNALALPVLDFNKWYSIHGKTDKNKEYGVENTLRNAFGNEAVGFIKRFIKDINGSQNVSRDVLGNTFFKNAKVASVAANLRVVLLQPTAYFKASAVMKNRYLAKAGMYIKVEPIGMVRKLKKAIAKAEKYCGIIQWKSLGYYDTDISKGLTEKIKHAERLKDKAVEKSLKLAEIADKVTFGVLWTACEFEIRDTRKDLKVGSDEFYDAISKRLREVIYATQVVDSTMTRSDMMRSPDRMDKMLTTFGSEPTIAYNMLADTVLQYNLDKRELGIKEAVKKNRSKVSKVLLAYTVTNAVAALVESGFDVFRDDDDEEMDIATFLEIYFKNFAMDMSIGNKLPVIKELYSIMQGYSSSRMDTQWMEHLVSAVTTWGKIFSGEGEGKGGKAIKHTARVFSELTGIAFYNAYRDTMALLDKLEIFTAEDLEEMLEDFLDY